MPRTKGVAVVVVVAVVAVVIAETCCCSMRFPGSENKGIDFIPVRTPERLGVGIPGMLKGVVDIWMGGGPLEVVEDAEGAEDEDGGGCLVRDTTPPEFPRPVWAIWRRPPS